MKICNYVLFITSFFISELLFAKINEYACYGGWRNKIDYVRISRNKWVEIQPPIPATSNLYCRGWQKHSESGSKACSDPRIKAYFENKLKNLIKERIGKIKVWNENYINRAVSRAKVFYGYDANFEGLGDKAFERKDDGSGELQKIIADVCY